MIIYAIFATNYATLEEPGATNPYVYYFNKDITECAKNLDGIIKNCGYFVKKSWLFAEMYDDPTKHWVLKYEVKPIHVNRQEDKDNLKEAVLSQM